MRMWKAVLLCSVLSAAFGATDVSERVVVYTGYGDAWSVYGPSSSPSWSFLGSNEKFWETCSCSSASSCANPSKYLVTSPLETGGAQRLTLSMLYSGRKCDASVKGQGICVEHIGIYAKLSNSKDTVLDPYKEAGFNLVANTSALTFPADKIFSDKTKFETHVTTSTAKYAAFGFLDVGFCGSISQVNISYLVCPSKSSALLEFPRTFAPSLGTITVQGTCAKNSETMGSAPGTMLCSADGKVTFSGGCVCREGFEMHGIECLACSLDHFKAEKGNQACGVCGKNSLAGSLRLKCTCNVGYYRPVNYANDNVKDCEQPPAQPRNLNASSITSTSAILSWNPPQDLGTGDNILYDVICGNCVDKTVFAENLNTTSFTLRLSSYVRYNFSVISVNNVTKATGVSKRSYVIFQTEDGVPGPVRNLEWQVNSDGSITLTWDPPFAKGGPDLSYIISYGDNTKTTVKTTYTIERSTSKKTYTFEVRAKTAAGLSAPVATPQVTQEGGVPLNLVLGILIPIIILFIFAVCVVVYCWRRRHPEHLQAVRLENGGVKLPTRFKGEKQYVDPLTYQDLAEAVTDIANTLERSWLDLENIIGGGEFGDVYKGTLTKPNDNGRHVAIKTLRPGANKQARDDFLSEAAIMGQFDHENVVILEGVVVKEKPMMIVTEFMSNGSLDGFLQANDGKFTCLQLLGMARGVSSGMTYLSEMGFIHRVSINQSDVSS